MQRRSSIVLGLTLLLLPLAPAAAQTTLPSYPDSTEGLNRLFKDLLTASEAKNENAIYLLARSMVLPNHKEWFKKTFGETIAPRMIKEFEETASRVDVELTAKFVLLREPSKLSIAITRTEAADDLSARVFQRFALAAMKEPTALYSVTLSLPGTTAKIEIWNIVHVEGAFRVVGKLQAVRG